MVRSRIRFVQSFVRTAKEYFRLNFPTDGKLTSRSFVARNVGKTIKDETEPNVFLPSLPFLFLIFLFRNSFERRNAK